MTTHLPRRLSQVTVQHIGPETLVYDERRHQAFCLNPTAAAVWNLADGTRTVDELASAASLQLAAPVTTEIVELALAGLERDGLLAAAPPLAFQVPAPMSRRAILGSLGATSLVLLPAVAALMAPKAAQAYSGCFDCTNATRPLAAAAAAQHRAEAQAAATKAAAARKAKQSTPESSPESGSYKPQ